MATEFTPLLERTAPVAVIGAGAMGSGIAQVAARAGHVVYLYDSNAEAPARGKQAMEKELRALVAKGRLADDECARILARVKPAARLDELADARLVIEAVVENLEVKRGLFSELEARLAADAILASNTSSLSITAIAAGLARPERFLGLHFFNPAPRMALVEIVSGLASDPALAELLVATMRAWGKVPVRARSTPGFIVNRVARPYYAEGLRVLDEGAASIATLDALMREGCSFPMGPFELMDLIGHDVNFAVTRSVFDAYFGDKRFTPSLIQQELVHARRLGRKTGRGFYDYAEGATRPAPAALDAQPRPERVVVHGELGPAAALVERIAAAGVPVERGEHGQGGAGAVGAAAGDGTGRAGAGDSSGAGCLRIGTATLALSDGRTATARAAGQGTPDLVLFDLALDYATTPRLGVAKADQCGDAAFAAAVGALQAAGIAVARLDDVAGLVGLRTVCMLANEAADAVLQGIASADDVDAAMRHGTNYPRGPLAWADALGIDFVVRVLGHLRAHYGEERYRVSPLLARKAHGGARFIG